MSWLTDRLFTWLGFRTSVTYDDDGGENFNLYVPGWVARRPWLVDRLTEAAVEALRDDRLAP